MAIQWKREAEQLDCAELGNWRIGAAADATPAETYAAEELQRWLAAGTGLELPVVTGDAEITIRADATMGDEQFSIRVDKAGIGIVGGPPRGCLYGVYQFMRDGQEGVLRAGIISLVIDANVRRWPAG